MTAARDALVQEALGTGTLTGLPGGHFIDGCVQPRTSGAGMPSFDPGTGRAFAEFAAGGADDVDRAVTSAQRAFSGEWGATAPAVRGRILHRAAELIRQQADRLAVVETLDSGKRLIEAEGDVRSAARSFDYYAGAADKLHGVSLPLGRDYVGFTIEEPVGVVAQIIPWNYPLSTAARGIAPALAAGCTVVAKPAEQTPFTALMLAQILTEAGLPAGAFNVVTGTGAEAGAALVAHPGIHHITFTGSVATGVRVMQSAANNITQVVLELGGKSPLVVLADADLDAALEGVLGAIFENAGQICSAGSRLILEHSIREEFIEKLVARTSRLSPGHGLLNKDVGPVNSLAQLQKIDAHVAAAKRAGNELHVGGAIAEMAGWFFQPTILSARSLEDPLVQEEIFGPVLTVQTADDAESAIALANGTEFALVAGIYTRDHAKAHRFARDVDAGQIYINEFFAAGIEAPFGGNRKSGFGREKGLEGLRSYCKVKSVVSRL